MFRHTRDNNVWIDDEKFTLADVVVVRNDYALTAGLDHVDGGFGFIVNGSDVKQVALESGYADVIADLESRKAEAITARTARLDAEETAREDAVDYDVVLKAVRTDLLGKCDWTQLPDVEAGGRLTTQQVADYATYRQSLADMPQDNPSVPNKAAYDALTWPTEPTV